MKLEEFSDNLNTYITYFLKINVVSFLVYKPGRVLRSRGSSLLAVEQENFKMYSKVTCGYF